MKRKSVLGAARKREGAAVAPVDDLLNLEQAIVMLKTTRPTFYRWLRAGKLTGHKAGRQWRFEKSDVERFLKGEGPQIELPVDINPLLRSLREKFPDRAPDKIVADGNVGTAARLMILLAAKMGASDLYIEPQPAEVALLRFRIGDAMHSIVDIDSRLVPALVAHWKGVAGCSVRDVSRPQEGRIVLQGGAGGHRIDVRVIFFPTTSGEAVSAALVDSMAARLSLRQLEFSAAVTKRIDRWAAAPWGTVVFTGPAGCGKTTSLYACLGEIAGHARRPKIMTVETEPEFAVPGVTQVLVQEAAGMSFGSGLRAVLRGNPDVVMVGEIRDLETLSLSLQGALTGHLMFISLHTSEAVSALKRMTDVGANLFTVSESVKLIVAQRLARKLCPECSVPRKPAEVQMKLARKLAGVSGSAWENLGDHFREPVGCKACHLTGYRGRQVLAEALEVSPRITAAMSRGATVADLRAIAVSEGMTTMAADGMRCATEGITSLAEVIKTVGSIYGAETVSGTA